MTSRVKRMFSMRNAKTEQPASPTAVAAPVDGTPKTDARANGTLPKVSMNCPIFTSSTDVGKDDELGTVNLLTEDVLRERKSGTLRRDGIGVNHESFVF